MNKKLLIIVFFIFSMVSSSVLISGVSSTDTKGQPNSDANINSLPNINTVQTIPGTNISYQYGMNTFDAHDTFQVTNNGTAYDSYKEQHIENITLDLVNLSSIVVQKYIFKIQESVYYIDHNTTRTFVTDNNSYDDYVNNVLNATGHWIINYVNPTFGVSDTAIITTTNQYLGSFPTNETLVRAKWDTLNVNITHVQQIIGVIISHTPIPHVQVQLNYTLSVDAYYAYFNAYNISYNIHAEQWLAQVRDGNRVGLSVSAFKNLQLNYTEIRFSVLSYYIASSLQISLKYMNGTDVPFENMPFNLRPAYFSQNGTVEDIGINVVNTTSLVASTTAVQAFHARLTQNINTNAAVTADSFVAWMVGSVPRLIAYKDANLDNQLNLEYNPLDGLHQSSGDYIPYVGVLEATRGNAISYHKYNQTYDQHLFTIQGFSVVNDTQNGVHEEQEDFQVYHLGFGTNVNTPPTFNPYFNTPTEASGAYVFNFGVEYINFPVEWVNITDGSSVYVPMNITYDYTYRINPTLGTAKLSPTITYGAIANATVKAAFNGLSLATLYQSDFLSAVLLRAQRTEQSTDNVTSTTSRGFASVSFSGPGNSFSSVDTSGGKAQYTLDGTGYGANTSILNLASFSGQAVGQNVTVFQSSNSDVMGSAMMKNTTTTTLNLNYRKDLILVSYPVWNGGKIVHDPSFSTVYQAGPSNSGSSSSSGSSNNNSSQQSSSEITGAPGFTFEMVAVLFAIGLLPLRHRRNKQQ